MIKKTLIYALLLLSTYAIPCFAMQTTKVAPEKIIGFIVSKHRTIKPHSEHAKILENNAQEYIKHLSATKFSIDFPGLPEYSALTTAYNCCKAGILCELLADDATDFCNNIKQSETNKKTLTKNNK